MRDQHQLPDAAGRLRCAVIHAGEHCGGQARPGRESGDQHDPESCLHICGPEADVAGMMLNLKTASTSRGPMLAPTPLMRKRVKPPALKMLPRPVRTRGLLASSALHVVLVAALI